MLLADDPDIFAHTLTYLADAPLDVQLSFVCSPSSAVDIVWMEPGESNLLGIVWHGMVHHSMTYYNMLYCIDFIFFFTCGAEKVVSDRRFVFSTRYVEYNIERGRFCCSGRRRPKPIFFC